MNINEFKKQYCQNCKEKCEKGIIETAQHIYCGDKELKIDKLKVENCKYYINKEKCKILQERICRNKKCTFYKKINI